MCQVICVLSCYYIQVDIIIDTVGHLYSIATNFANGARKGVRGNYFHETTLAELFTIHMNLHTMEFPLIFDETNFVEVPKSAKFTALEKRVPYGKRVVSLENHLIFRRLGVECIKLYDFL